ncbi:hypothetical protein [Faecalibacterium prausnitzii]|uniref:hypothetical protein n=1 Tax=Faecalibacterium prausnitzii TaxID=853 RepID=UPI0026661822|nr:hypothetical protein [Faecalibacterium prausnitzii]
MDSRILHYEFVTGESVNITVSAEIAEVIYDSRRMKHASNERSRYLHVQESIRQSAIQLFSEAFSA